MKRITILTLLILGIFECSGSSAENISTGTTPIVASARTQPLNGYGPVIRFTYTDGLECVSVNSGVSCNWDRYNQQHR